MPLFSFSRNVLFQTNIKPKKTSLSISLKTIYRENPFSKDVGKMFSLRTKNRKSNIQFLGKRAIDICQAKRLRRNSCFVCDLALRIKVFYIPGPCCSARKWGLIAAQQNDETCNVNDLNEVYFKY